MASCFITLHRKNDVTARRTAQALEANEHRLLMEVDHRAMNALALVQSIVSLTRADTDEGLSQAIRRRVDALARAHRLLATRHWRGVGLHELVQTQVPKNAHHRVWLDGPPVQMATYTVQPLALVLHELFSNAQMHGALSGETGRVRLSCVASGATLQLRWDESEIVYEEATHKNILGLAIVRNVVEGQLNGRVTRTVEGSDLVVAIDVPEAVEGDGG